MSALDRSLFGDCYDDALELCDWLAEHRPELAASLSEIAISHDPDMWLADYLSHWLATDELPDGYDYRDALEAARLECWPEPQLGIPGVPQESAEHLRARRREDRLWTEDSGHTCTGDCYHLGSGCREMRR